MKTPAPPIARQMSRRAIIRAIVDSGPASRAELAKRTGLSKQTVSEVVQQLAAAGWLSPSDRTKGRPGRSGQVYEINAPAGIAAAVDLGGTKVSVALGDLLGKAIAELTVPTDPRGGQYVVDQVAASVRTLIEEMGLELTPLRLVVMGVPGAVQPETSAIRVAPNIKNIGSVDVPAAVSAQLSASVIIENDVNLAALGEQVRGRGVGVPNFAFIALGTGIGMGIVADGHLLRGARGAAGEIGYLPIGGDPFDSRNFEVGTFEAAAGSVAVRDRYLGYGGAKGINVYEIFSAMEAGDPVALATIEETGRVIAQAVAAVGATLDPELVILGGSIGSRSELLEIVRRNLRRCSSAPARIETSALGPRAGLIGALELAAERMRREIFSSEMQRSLA